MGLHNLPPYLQRLIDECPVDAKGAYAGGIHDAYKAMMEHHGLVGACEKHTRALELKIEELENYNIELQRETDHE